MATITKRNGTYKITVSCGYNTIGKQIRKSLTWKPLPNMTPKQAEKEVQRQAFLFEEKVLNGDFVDNDKIRLEEFCPQYLENVKAEISPTTYQAYVRVIKNYIIPSLGHFKLKDIKPVHVQRFVNELTKVENARTNKPLEPSIVRRYYVVLQSILHNAYSLELISTNPSESRKIKLPALGMPVTEIFTKEETEEMLICLEDEPLMFKVLIHLALVTGCRRGELVALKWEDINNRNKVLSVRKSSYKLKGEAIKTKETKTNKERSIMLPDYCIDLLKKLKVEQARQRLLMGDKWKNGNWIFTQFDGTQMYPSTPTAWFDKFLKRHNMAHRKFHALRHTSATLLLGSGTNIKNVASRLGHSQLSTTNRYVHTIEEAEKAAANTFENTFSQAVKRA